jgi:hypothetical protein
LSNASCALSRSGAPVGYARAESSSPATLSKSREAHHGRTGHLSALDPANLRVGHADGVSQRFLAQAVLESGQA